MIIHKIENVSDELCNQCQQCWQEECKAFQMPHSEEEKQYRQKDKALCSISIFRWAFDKEYPERNWGDMIKKVEELRDKLHRRNMQIKDIKKKDNLIIQALRSQIKALEQHLLKQDKLTEEDVLRYSP